MPADRIPRRRCLSILAGLGALALSGDQARRAAALEWRGVALGAEARLLFHGPDRERAQAALRRILAEVERLERIFSLYRPESELCRLNAAGRLAAPSFDLLAVLALGQRISEASGGAFDPSVQPLWRALARHFARRPGAAPTEAQLAPVLALVDHRRIKIAPDRITLGPGMALTLNGIAQGYVTDRVSDLLRGLGFGSVLVQFGETRALPGRVWRVGAPGFGRPFGLSGMAVATSAGAATPLSRDGRWTHLLHPRRGPGDGRFRSVTVVAATAAEADALSTALAVVTAPEADRLARRFPEARVIAIDADGRRLHLGSANTKERSLVLVPALRSPQVGSSPTRPPEN